MFTGSGIQPGPNIVVPGISTLPCYVCGPGETYAFGRRTPGKAYLGVGTYASGSNPPENFRLWGWLTFIAPTITLPAAGMSSITYNLPFRARVSLDGLSLDQPGGGIFARWEGSGLAHATFSPTSDGRWDNSEGTMLRFEFTAADPVPEPATMLLLGTGLAGVAAARRRTRRE